MLSPEQIIQAVDSYFHSLQDKIYISIFHLADLKLIRLSHNVGDENISDLLKNIKQIIFNDDIIHWEDNVRFTDVFDGYDFLHIIFIFEPESDKISFDYSVVASQKDECYLLELLNTVIKKLKDDPNSISTREVIKFLVERN